MRCTLSFSLLIVAAAALAAPVPPAPPTPPGGFLVLDNCDPEFKGKAAYEDNLTAFDWSGKARFRVSGFNNAEGVGCNRKVAVDAAGKAVWVLEDAGRRVRKFDLEGKHLLELKGLTANALAVDPDTGNVWVLTSSGTIYGDKTAVYSREGKLLAEHGISGWDVAYDAKGKAFWVAGKHLYKVSAKQLLAARPGDLTVRSDVAGWCVASVTVNQKTGQVWALSREYSKGYGRDELLGFDNAGRPTVTVPLGTGDRKAYPFHLSVDSKTGAVWVAMMGDDVRRFTAEGKANGRFEVSPLAVQADESTGGAWVVTKEDVRRLNAKGELLKQVKHRRPTSQAWIAAYR